MGGLYLIVGTQTAGLHQPAESPLDDPPLGQEFEAFGLVAAAHDVQMPPDKRTQGLDPCDQLARIAAVSPDAGQPVIEKGTRREQAHRTLAVLDTGWGDVQGEH